MIGEAHLVWRLAIAAQQLGHAESGNCETKATLESRGSSVLLVSELPQAPAPKPSRQFGDRTLGQLLALGQRSQSDIELWLAGQAPDLAQQVVEQARLRGEGVAQFVRIAAADFLAEADEESWADLVSALRDAADPGAQCVTKMVAFRIRLERAN